MEVMEVVEGEAARGEVASTTGWPSWDKWEPRGREGGAALWPIEVAMAYGEEEEEEETEGGHCL